MAVTLRDVAARAGVSPVVVSHVLHNRAQSIRVSQATAERVRAAAEELGYRLNVLARNFRQGQTEMIGVLHGIGFQRPEFGKGSRYFASLMDGIVEGAFRHGYSVTLCPKLLSESPQDALNDGRFDGLLWYSTVPSEQNRQMVIHSRVPLVVLHSPPEAFECRHPTVICDNDGGIRLGVDHLVSLGHRRIAFAVQQGLRFGEEQARYDAYLKYMQGHGLADCTLLLEEDDRLDTAIATTSCSAILACSDELAMRILNRANRLGKRVPDDLSLVGFDSTSYCDESHPRLTSVHQPLYEIGDRAVEVLVDLIRCGLPTELTSIIPCGLDLRESTSRPQRP